MRFILDRSLGRLCRWLRILGYDAIYWSRGDVEGMLHCAHEQGRALITRVTRAYALKGVLAGILIKEDDPLQQLREVLDYFHLAVDKDALFSRCLLCNSPLQEIDRVQARGRVPDHVFHTQDSFSFCPQCQRIYWPGTHYSRMLSLVESLLEGDSEGHRG